MFICDPGTEEQQSIYVPVATESMFEKMWQPGVMRCL